MHACSAFIFFFFSFISGSFNYLTVFISTVFTDALSKDLIPTDKILLSSNSPRVSNEKFKDSMAYQLIASQNKDKLPINMKRTEPLCVFLTLEIVAKALGYVTPTEIQDFGKITMKNSKTFLGYGNNVFIKSVDKKGKEANSKWEHRTERRLNKRFVLSVLIVTIFALFLEYLSGDPEFLENYLTKQILF